MYYKAGFGFILVNSPLIQEGSIKRNRLLWKLVLQHKPALE